MNSETFLQELLDTPIDFEKRWGKLPRNFAYIMLLVTPAECKLLLFFLIWTNHSNTKVARMSIRKIQSGWTKKRSDVWYPGTGLSANTIQKAISRLEKRGILKVHRSDDHSVRNGYQLLLDGRQGVVS